MNNEYVKFFLQYLISPIVIAIVGFVINSNINERKQKLETYKFYADIFTDAFNDDNPEKGLKLANMLPLLMEDKFIADSFKNNIYAYYQAVLEKSLINGDEAKLESVAKAITENAPPVTNQDINEEKNNIVINNAKTISKRAQIAKEYEKKGLESIEKNDLATAKKNFDSAEKTYNGYHNAYEISKLLNKNIQELNNNPANKEIILSNVKTNIEKKYSWGLEKKNAKPKSVEQN